jgi:hypothetical protein
MADQTTVDGLSDDEDKVLKLRRENQPSTSLRTL